MAQWIKELASKPDDLSSNPETATVKRKNPHKLSNLQIHAPYHPNKHTNKHLKENV